MSLLKLKIKSKSNFSFTFTFLKIFPSVKVNWELFNPRPLNRPQDPAAVYIFLLIFQMNSWQRQKDTDNDDNNSRRSGRQKASYPGRRITEKMGAAIVGQWQPAAVFPPF